MLEQDVVVEHEPCDMFGNAAEDPGVPDEAVPSALVQARLSKAHAAKKNFNDVVRRCFARLFEDALTLKNVLEECTEYKIEARVEMVL